MAIVPLVKVTLYGPAPEKGAVLDALQRLGCVHLDDLRPPEARTHDAPGRGTDARAALQYLRDCPVRRRPAGRAADLDLTAVVRDTLAVRDRAHDLAEERERLRRAVAETEPWGEFELPSWAREGALRLWFYPVPHHRMPVVQALDVPWQVVGRDHRLSHVVVVAPEAPAGMPVAPITLDPRPLSAQRARLQDVERELEELDYRRIGLTLHADALASDLAEADDRAAREQAALGARERDQLFALRGWAPAARADALRRLAADRQLALTVEAPGPGDAPPTLLDNPPALRGGEGLVTFYRTPGYGMWDPSQAVFFVFAAFFGMILSDAAYGALIGVGTLLAWKRLGRTPSGIGMRGLLVALAVASIVYGVLVGSYFGLVPRPGTPLGRLHVIDAEDMSLMMLISLATGVAHLTFANLQTAWRRRGSLATLGPLGWACVLLGGFWAGVARTRPALAGTSRVGVIALLVGLGLVLLFSDHHPLSLAPRALLARFLEGLKSLTEISKVFGDVLSYLRLFALGLAAIKLAEAFNHLAAGAFAMRGAGVLLGIVVLLVGHTINLAMGVMGGVVHGLRLNVIEFFNWSLPEEGEGFRAFAKKATP